MTEASSTLMVIGGEDVAAEGDGANRAFLGRIGCETAAPRVTRGAVFSRGK
jgi:hypothetical protein